MDDGLNPSNFDTEMLRFKNKIKKSSDKISEYQKSIKESEETLSTLKAEGLVTPELEQTFNHAIQESCKEIETEKANQHELLDAASEKIERAREVCDKEIAGVKNKPGSHAAQVYHSLCERKASIDHWETELQEAANTDNP